MSSSPFKGEIRPGREVPGARFVLVSHRPASRLEAHQHDWPNLTIHLAGACIERFDGQAMLLDRPGAVFHPARSGHSDDILAGGLETAGLMFDPAWLGGFGKSALFDRPRAWQGGRTTLALRTLVSAWREPSKTEAMLRQVTETAFQLAAEDWTPAPPWLAEVTGLMEARQGTATIARAVGLHPAWLARRYREATGEGLQESIRRRRVEAALSMLRTSSLSLAEIALEAGFCDQPHMNRCFRAVLYTTPSRFRPRDPR